MLSLKVRSPPKDLSLLRIVLVLSISYFSLSLNQFGFVALLPFVREEFVLTRTQVGLYSTCFFLGATVTAIFTGGLVDKLGAKKSLLLGMGCFGFTMLVYGVLFSYGALLFLAIFAGIGMSIITPSVNKGILLAVPPEKRAVYMGIVQSISGFGSTVGASLLPILGKSFGWRTPIEFSAVFALLVGLLAWKLYQEPKKSSSILDNRESQREKQPSFKNGILALLGNKQVLRLCAIGIVLGASFGAVSSHLAVFFHEDLNMSPTYAGLGLSIFYFGGIIGQPIWGRLSDRSFRGDRQKVLIVIGLTVGVVYLLFNLFFKNLQASPFAVFVFSFLLGCSAWGWTGVYMIAIGESVGDRQTGIATGLSLVFIRTGMLVAPLVFGFIADVKGNYRYSWLLFGVAIILVFSLFYYLSTQKRKDEGAR